MSDENKQYNQQQNQTQQNPAQKQATTPDLTNQLLEAFLKREKVALQEHENKENLVKQRTEHYAKNSANKHRDLMKTQSRCKHKKGGALQRPGNVDFAVSLHTYIDRTRVIKCHICAMKWRKDDTDQFLVRGGKQVKNHTGIGWAKAYDMLVSSTNKSSSTEIPLDNAPNITPGETEDGELITYEL
jgi:hypothetical protein